ncbi:MAG: OmpH family outer membrane protein [Alphaproteobacteria bacterium]|nr:OmpH family outer membrane protein [Alphaproteobacteria bacterium]
MTYKYSLLVSLALSTVLTLGTFVSGTKAQEIPVPKIGVIDVQKVLRDSKAAKSIRPEFDKMRKAFQKQVSEQEQQLRQAEQELTRQRAILAPEAFSQKRRSFSEEARRAQNSSKKRRRQLDRAFNDTKNEILKNLVMVARQVAAAKKLNMLLEKRFVFLSAKTMDVTNDVIARLDKRLPKLAVKLGKASQDTGKGKN